MWPITFPTTAVTVSGSVTPTRRTSRPGSEDVLVEGDVVTLEPGLYVDDVGGMRFERNYLITSTGFESADASPSRALAAFCDGTL